MTGNLNVASVSTNCEVESNVKGEIFGAGNQVQIGTEFFVEGWLGHWAIYYICKCLS